DRGAIAEANDCVSVFRRANDLTTTDLLSGLQLARLRIRNEIQRSVSGLYGCIKTAQRNISLQNRQRDQPEANHQCGGNSPTQDDRPQTVLRSSGCRASHSGRGNTSALFARLLQSPPAGNTFVRVIDQQQRSRFRELAAEIS